MTAAAPSLQRRLLLGIVGAVVAVWLVTAVYLVREVRHELDELLDGHLAQAAALLVVQQLDDIEDDHAVRTPELHRHAPRVAFQVWHEGRLVLRSANAPQQPMGAVGSAFQPGLREARIDGIDWHVFAAVSDDGDTQAFVGELDRSRTDILVGALRGSLLPMALALPLLALAIGWAVRRGLLPLRRFGELLRARDPRDREPVVLPGAAAEMQPMIGALNGLFERIGALIESERRFTADAAHELRTPIAAIRAQAQVALGESDDAARRHALQATIEGCDRATRLVGQLLTLARLEAADAAPAGRVDLAALTRRTAAELAPRALGHHQDLVVEAPADGAAVVRGDETLCGVLLRNLIDNAARYSPDGAPVNVTLGTTAGAVRLVVEDGGPGLDDAAQARLGERFFRVLGTQASGSGLGWSIVRRIAEAHGATVHTDRSPTLGGLRVSVDWPAA